MTPTDRFEPAMADGCIITRSDHAPTPYERYGDWARKFFGYGCHHAYKDAALAATPAAAPARRTPTRH